MEGNVTALPPEPDDQLQLGFRMIQNSYNAKVQELEQELRGLQLYHEEQKTHVAAAQRKHASLEGELVESHQRCQLLSDENRELFKTVQTLRVKIQKLEELKKKVMEAYAEEGSQVENVGGNQQLTSRSLALPAIDPPGHVPRAAPREPASSVQARSSSDRHVSPRESPWPPPSVPPQDSAVGGKIFFQTARRSLSRESFQELLANIKKLNSQLQSREECLEDARRIFGPEHQHLYAEFEQLLQLHSV
uniref:At4g15545-like C-terminal domain-containing protein n=1 Tax=Noctiluca scintillans TaxID=2966 RepID=A0A7S0ZZT7_NOCSC